MHLKNDQYQPENNHAANLIDFMLLDEIPNDLKMSLFMDLNKEGDEEVKKMLKDKKLASLLLSSM